MSKAKELTEQVFKLSVDDSEAQRAVFELDYKLRRVRLDLNHKVENGIARL
jgi:hypothetical protein